MPKPNTTQPNIILIIADDLGYQDLACYGGTEIETPNLDQLAKEGIRFRQAYSGCPVCAPSRSVLMTGYHAGHTPVRGNSGGIPLQSDDVTLATLLKAGGYTCGGFGKWGLGDIGTTGMPENHGFDRFFGYYHQVHAHTYYPAYLWQNSQKVPLDGNSDGDEGQTYSHYRIFEETCNFIRQNRDRSFFCYAPWTLPHGRYAIPEDEPAWRQYKDRPWSRSAKVVAAMIALLDQHIGKLRQLLREERLDQNTIILVTSDHGASFRFEGELDSCGSLRGQKRTLYEGGIRVPLIVHCPDRIWFDRMMAGQVSDHPCYFPDIMPTLLELVGLPCPEGLDGISIVPTLTGQSSQPKHNYLYWALPLYDFGRRQFHPNGLMEALRKDNWKVVRHLAGEPIELYDLDQDAGEIVDLAERYPDRTAQMAELLSNAQTDGPVQIEPEMPTGKRYR